jgi:hypothetical protein
MMFGCLRRIIVLVLLLALLAGGWLYRDRLRELWREVRGQPALVVVLPSRELADAADAKLEALRTGAADRAALSEVELQSLLAYRYAGVLPGFVDSAVVELDDDRIRLRADVPIDRLPSVSELGEAASFLPDTSELTLTGSLLPLPGERVGLAINEVTVARIPLPRRLVPAALRRLGRRDEAGLPADAIPLPLPSGATSAYIRGDSLVLIGRGGTP